MFLSNQPDFPLPSDFGRNNRASEAGISTQASTTSANEHGQQPDLLLQYVDSLESHSLIDRAGEVAICKDIESQYCVLYRAVSKSPKLLLSLAELTRQAVESAGIEDIIYLRRDSEHPETKDTPSNAKAEMCWLEQLEFHAQHLNHAACKDMSRTKLNQEIEYHLNQTHIDIRVLKILSQSHSCTRSAKSAIKKIHHQRDALIHSNLRLVISVARKFKDRGMSYVDLIQEGNVGLIKAAVRFDYRKGFKFSTYAHWWIWQSIKLGIAKQRNTIRLPTHVHDQVAKLFAIKEHLQGTLNRDPEIAEIGERMGLSRDEIESLIKLSQDPVSFDMPVGETGDTTLGATVSGDESLSAELPAATVRIGQYIAKLLDHLSAREQKILKMRYGIGLHDAYTLEHVAHQIGLTRERVRQIEKEALAKIQEIAQQTPEATLLGS